MQASLQTNLTYNELLFLHIRINPELLNTMGMIVKNHNQIETTSLALTHSHSHFLVLQFLHT